MLEFRGQWYTLVDVEEFLQLEIILCSTKYQKYF
jgi:hypothetical protein